MNTATKLVPWLHASLITGMSIPHIALLVKNKCVRGHRIERKVSLSGLIAWNETNRPR